MLGFALAAVSPAVVVSCLLSLQDRGYGVVKVNVKICQESLARRSVILRAFRVL